jgi:hypothetical protein
MYTNTFWMRIKVPVPIYAHNYKSAQSCSNTACAPGCAPMLVQA